MKVLRNGSGNKAKSVGLVGCQRIEKRERECVCVYEYDLVCV